MNILFISPSSDPFKGEGWGSLQRTNLLFEAFAQLGFVDIIAFYDHVQSDRENCHVVYSHSEKREQHRGRFAQLIQTVFPNSPYSLFPKNEFRSSIVKSFIEKNNYDYIVCRYIPSALECGLLDFPDNKIIIDIDDYPRDVEIMYSKTARSFRKRLYHRYRSLIISNQIKRIQSSCFVTFLANPLQASLYNSVYLPNIPFYDYNIPLVDFKSTTPRILFVGNLSYGPNIRGINYFLDNIFPIIYKALPDVELNLVGGCHMPVYTQTWNKIQGVHYLGYIDDIQKEYINSRVVIVPIYEGAGTNIKVLEAMKLKRPCVTTGCGYRGFTEFFSPNKDLIVADDSAFFAKQVINLLTNENFNHFISNNAYSVVKEKFSRSTFNGIVKNSLNHGR